MSLVATAKRQIKKYGFKGAAILTPLASTTDDLGNLTVSPIFGSAISLNSYIGSYKSSRVDNTLIFADDKRVLATPDADWDGILTESDKITILTVEHSIINFDTKRVGNKIAYVEIQCRG